MTPDIKYCICPECGRHFCIGEDTPNQKPCDHIEIFYEGITNKWRYQTSAKDDKFDKLTRNSPALLGIEEIKEFNQMRKDMEDITQIRTRPNPPETDEPELPIKWNDDTCDLIRNNGIDADGRSITMAQDINRITAHNNWLSKQIRSENGEHNKSGM